MKKFIPLLKTVTLVVLSTITTLCIGELLVRIILPQDKMVTWIEMHERGFVMNQQTGIAFQEFGKRRADYRFNKYRLRGGELTNAPTRILTIGDSFTFGLLLNEEDTYVHHLQEKADSVFPDSIQFMNAAVGGSGLADWPGWLKEFGEELQPDYLLYFMNYDDINRALSKNLFIFDSLATDSLIPSKRWEPRTIMQSLGRQQWYKWLQAHSELTNIIVKVLWKYANFKDVTHNFDVKKSEVPLPSLSSYNEVSDYSNQLANAILQKISDWCIKNNCALIILTTGFFEGSEMSGYDRKFYESIKNSEFQLKDAYFDISPCVSNYFELSLDEIRIPTDSHPNELGAEIIANCSWEIIENKLSN